MIQDIYDATIDSVLEGFDDCEHSLVRNAYQKYLQDYYSGFTVVTPDNSRYELLVGFHITTQNESWFRKSLDAKKRDLFRGEKSSIETVFHFHEDSGPFAYYEVFDYSIELNNGVYSCNCSVGWDDANFFSRSNIPEKHIIRFLKQIKKSLISKWDKFHESQERVLDGSRVSLTAKHEKAGIDLDMSGYSCWPPEFEKGASIIVKEYNELLKKTGEALEKMESTEISILRMKTGETCELMGPVFKIGRAVKGSSPTQDYSITDNSAISRSHAEIIMRNGHYYIVDQGSNNKTFVDGVSIAPNTEVEISLESCIRLADEEFRFTSSKRQLFAKRLK